MERDEESRYWERNHWERNRQSGRTRRREMEKKKPKISRVCVIHEKARHWQRPTLPFPASLLLALYLLKHETHTNCDDRIFTSLVISPYFVNFDILVAWSFDDSNNNRTIENVSQSNLWKLNFITCFFFFYQSSLSWLNFLWISQIGNCFQLRSLLFSLFHNIFSSLKRNRLRTFLLKNWIFLKIWFSVSIRAKWQIWINLRACTEKQVFVSLNETRLTHTFSELFSRSYLLE